jgi:hypothetical protein
MTCVETRAYFENVAFENDQCCDHSAEVAEHVRTCADCNRFIGERSELNRRLSLVRDAAPQISSTLDSAVLANFRGRTERLIVSNPTQLPIPVSRPSALWLGAFAAVVLGAVVLAVTYRRATPHGGAVRAPRPVMVSQSTHAVSAPPAPKEVAPVGRIPPSHHAKRMASAPVAALAVQHDSFPAGFASLMYCDQLSCGEPMEIIRMQLPTSIAGHPSAWPRRDSAVYADVLIGSDGVARGIRMVE